MTILDCNIVADVKCWFLLVNFTSKEWNVLEQLRWLEWVPNCCHLLWVMSLWKSGFLNRFVSRNLYCIKICRHPFMLKRSIKVITGNKTFWCAAVLRLRTAVVNDHFVCWIQKWKFILLNFVGLSSFFWISVSIHFCVSTAVIHKLPQVVRQSLTKWVNETLEKC